MSRATVTIPNTLSASEKERLVDLLVAALEKDAGKKLDPEWTRGFARQFLICFGVMFSDPLRMSPPPPTNER